MFSRSPRVYVSAFSVGALLLATPVFAQHGPPITIAERGQGANIVVVGSIESSVPLYRTNKWGDNLIVSQLSVHVSEFLKGSGPDFLPVEVDGGTVNGLTMKTSDLPELHVGDTVVFFLHREPSGDYTPHLRGYGLLRLDRNGVVEHSSLSLQQIRSELRGAGR